MTKMIWNYRNSKSIKSRAEFYRLSRRTNMGSFGVSGLSRRSDGLLITSKNSGKHWVMYMLSHAFAHQYNKNPPAYSSGDRARDFILAKDHPAKHLDIPKVYQSHTIPSGLIKLLLAQKICPIANTIVLVRDIRQALLSHYVKWKNVSQVSLSEYIHGLQGGINKKRFNADLWWYILFFNRWGELSVRYPDKVIVVKYEDILLDPISGIYGMASHWGVSLDDKSLEAAAAVSGKDSIAVSLDPNYPEAIVSNSKERDAAALSDEDNRFIEQAFSELLIHNLGYPYPTCY